MNRILRLPWMGLALVLALLALAPAGAQQPEPRKAGPGPFDRTDFVYLRLGALKKSYFVGEPVVLPLRILNHTRGTITIATNFVPGSMLQVKLRPEEQRQRNYTGPYEVGGYLTADLLLDPLDEYPYAVVLYADREAPGGLAFAQPGRYTIDLGLKIEVRETGVSGQITVPPFQIEVTSTPQALQPLVQGLVQHKLAREVHLQLIQPEHLAVAEKLLAAAPPSPLTPILGHALGQGYLVAWQRDPKNTRLGDTAVFYLNGAYLSDSPLRFNILQNLITALDLLQRGPEAKVAVDLMLQTMDPFFRGKVGLDLRLKAGKQPPSPAQMEKNLFHKYLRNVNELLPTHRYWQLFH